MERYSKEKTMPWQVLDKRVMGKEEKKNINRGYKRLRVWNDAIQLYVLACDILLKLPYKLAKVVANSIDSAHSISRNIAEGYCRRSLKEYLNFLNFSLASCGEFHSCCESFRRAGQMTEEDFLRVEEVHFKLENELISLIRSLQKKQAEGDWEESFLV